jgi:hypothetical protein
MPASTIASHNASYSAWLPSHHTMRSGRVRAAISRTQPISRGWRTYGRRGGRGGERGERFGSIHRGSGREGGAKRIVESSTRARRAASARSGQMA